MNRGALWALAVALGCSPSRGDVSLDGLLRETARASRVTAEDTAATEPDGASASVDGLVERALARDPGMRARALRARSLVEAARAEGSLPSPEADVQVWNVPFARPWSVGEASMYMVELRQRLPAWGLRDARHRAALSDAVMALAAASDRARELSRGVREAWAMYLEACEHLRVHGAHHRVVDGMFDAARARTSVGGGLDDVTRVSLEQARVHRLLARYEADRDRALRTLNALAQRPLDAPAPAAPLDALRGETVRDGLDALVDTSFAHRAMVLEARARAVGARASLEGARAEATRPELMVGVSGWFDPEHHNGYGLNAGMTLPWLWGPGRARVAAGELRAQAEEAAVREAELAVRAEVVEAHGRVVGLARELAVLRAQGLAASSRAVESAGTGYVTGSVPLVMWLDAARMRLEAAEEEVELVGALARALAALDAAVGAPVARVPVTEAP